MRTGKKRGLLLIAVGHNFGTVCGRCVESRHRGVKLCRDSGVRSITELNKDIVKTRNKLTSGC